MIDLVEELSSDVMVTVPGCPDMVVDRALARAARQFCSDTHAWRVTTEPQPVIQGLREVQLGTPTNTSILRPYWVTLEGRQLFGVSESALVAKEGKPSGYAISSEGVLLLDRLPTETIVQDALIANFSVTPQRGHAILADELDPYLEAVQILATAFLLTMPNVEWRDPKAASDMFSLYQGALPEARRFGQQHNQSIHRKVAYGGI